jgi:ABC-type bacteriocin/lantibiotic exporter with double-glycine peptidase domain
MSGIFFLVSGLFSTIGGFPSEEQIHLEDYVPCGITSLYLVSRLNDIPATYDEITALVGPVSQDGTHSFADLSKAAEQLGLHPVGLRANRSVLGSLPLPAILHVRDLRGPKEKPHLVVLLRVESDGVVLLDPPTPAYFLADKEFNPVWTGSILVFARNETALCEKS